MVKPGFFEATLLAAGFIVSGCGSSPTQAKTDTAAPAKVDNRVKENDLTRITLIAEAEKRLGIELATVTERTSADRIQIAGDVLAIPGKALIVAAPASGTVAPSRSGITVGQAVRNGQPYFG